MSARTVPPGVAEANRPGIPAMLVLPAGRSSVSEASSSRLAASVTGPFVWSSRLK